MAKILVVEDTQMIWELIKMVLEPRGHELIHTANGSEAFALAKGSNPELVLLDVMLPGMDGYSVQNQFYEDEELKNIPIIMMTSKSQMEELFKTAQNVAAFIPKPFTVKELTEKISSVLNGKK